MRLEQPDPLDLLGPPVELALLILLRSLLTVEYFVVIKIVNLGVLQLNCNLLKIFYNFVMCYMDCV